MLEYCGIYFVDISLILYTEISEKKHSKNLLYEYLETNYMKKFIATLMIAVIMILSGVSSYAGADTENDETKTKYSDINAH